MSQNRTESDLPKITSCSPRNKKLIPTIFDNTSVIYSPLLRKFQPKEFKKLPTINSRKILASLFIDSPIVSPNHSQNMNLCSPKSVKNSFVLDCCNICDQKLPNYCQEEIKKLDPYFRQKMDNKFQEKLKNILQRRVLSMNSKPRNKEKVDKTLKEIYVFLLSISKKILGG